MTGRILAMVLVACVAVSVAAVLVRARGFVAAGAVLVGAAFGQRTLVATPVRGSLMRGDGMDAVMWWHVVVGSGLVAILTVWTLSVARHVPVPLTPVTQVPLTAALALVASVGFLVCYLTQEPQTSAVIGIVP